MPIRKPEPSKTPRRRPSEEEEEKPTTGKKTTGKGWAGLAKKQKEIADNKERWAEEKDKLRDFYLTEKDNVAIIQIIDDEPYCYDGHSVTIDKRWKTLPCQLHTQRHCLMCREDIKTVFQAGFRVLDYRGTWSKEKGFTHDKPVEKWWSVGATIASQLKAFSERKRKDLSKMVIEVSRSGSGKGVSYNFQLAEDEDGERMEPNTKIKSAYKSLEDLMDTLIPTDDFLESSGFEAPEY